MADPDQDPQPDDSTTDAERPVYNSTDDALKADPRPLVKDPGETAPEIPENQQGVGEMDPDMIKNNEINESVQKTNEARKSIEGIERVTHPMWNKYRSMIQEDMQNRQMQDQQLEKQTTQAEVPQQKKADWTQAMSTLLAVAVPIALAFGLKGNGYAKGALMSALGAAMKGFAEGRDKAGKEALLDYKAQAASIDKSNRERHQIYKDILSNKKLELEDQFKLIHSVSQEFMDPNMAKAARERSMPGVTKQMENQKKVADRFKKGAKEAGDKIYKLPHELEYEQYKKDTGKDITYTEWEEKHSTAADRARSAKETPEDPDAPPTPDEAASMRSKILGDE